MQHSFFTPNKKTEAIAALLDRIWYFESHLLATSDVELIKQHLRLIIDKTKGGGVLMAEDKYSAVYFATAFLLASSFNDDKSHVILFGQIYEELVPLGLAIKIKTEDEVAALSKAESSCANIPTFDTNPRWMYGGFDCNGELDDATSERLISSFGHAEDGLISNIGE
jgi:hypothetical protein